MPRSYFSSVLAAALLLSTSLAPLHASAYQDDSDVDSESSSNAAVARLQVRISELEDQLRKLQGAMEQVSFSNRQLKSQIDKMHGDIDYRLSALEKGATTTAPSPAPATTTPPASQPDDQEQTEPSKYTPVQKTAPAAQPDGVQHFASSHEHYSYGFKLLNQGKYADAGNVFSAFTERYAKDPLIGHAFYWLGETYYVRQDYVKAADNFRQGYEAMPTGNKASDNLLKLALTLDKLGKSKESCVVLKQVGSKFGKTSAGVKARVEQEITRLHCE